MTKNKLISLFQKEKIRVQAQIINPIKEVVNNPKYDQFFRFFVIANINKQIITKEIDIPSISLLDIKHYDEIINQKEYRKLYENFIDKICEVNNFDVFKLVFGEQSYKPWALNFYKLVIFTYYEAKNLVNIKNLLFTANFDQYSLTSDTDFDVITDIIFKSIYGYSFTSIYNFEYWQQVTGITEKIYNALLKVVVENNPAIELINTFLYFHKPLKDELYLDKEYHTFKAFEPSKQAKLEDPEIALNWLIDYFACLTLFQKLQIGLWKSIQSLTFGKRVNDTVIKMKTIAEVKINVSNVWNLDKISKDFFKNLKLLVILNLHYPNDFEKFINQTPEEVALKVKPNLVKYAKTKQAIEKEFEGLDLQEKQ